MKPSDCLKHPYDSVLHKMEPEIVARNIMVILSRNGNFFRDISWEEYEAERMKDGSFTAGEYSLFEKVRGYCNSENMASRFSEVWNK